MTGLRDARLAGRPALVQLEELLAAVEHDPQMLSSSWANPRIAARHQFLVDACGDTPLSREADQALRQLAYRLVDNETVAGVAAAIAETAEHAAGGRR